MEQSRSFHLIVKVPAEDGTALRSCSARPDFIPTGALSMTGELHRTDGDGLLDPGVVPRLHCERSGGPAPAINPGSPIQLPTDEGPDPERDTQGKENLIDALCIM